MENSIAHTTHEPTDWLRTRCTAFAVRICVSACLFFSSMFASTTTSAAVVPELVGITYDSAAGSAQLQLLLMLAGVTLGEVTFEDTVCVPTPGQITSQDPVAGTVVPLDSAVDIVVSSREGITIPDVTGLSYGMAISTISRFRLTTGTVTVASDAGVSAGFVSSQNPPADACLDRDSSVDMVVSSGEAPGGSVIFADDFQSGTSAWTE